MTDTHPFHDLLAEQAWGVLVAAEVPDPLILAHAITRNQLAALDLDGIDLRKRPQRWTPGRKESRGKCGTCGREVSARNGKAYYHYEHPRGPLNPRGMACAGHGQPVTPL